MIILYKCFILQVGIPKMSEMHSVKRSLYSMLSVNLYCFSEHVNTAVSKLFWQPCQPKRESNRSRPPLPLVTFCSILWGILTLLLIHTLTAFNLC